MDAFLEKVRRGRRGHLSQYSGVPHPLQCQIDINLGTGHISDCVVRWGTGGFLALLVACLKCVVWWWVGGVVRLFLKDHKGLMCSTYRGRQRARVP